MSSGPRTATLVVALLLVVVGFAAGAGGSAWQTRELSATRWRKLRVEHTGVSGVTTRTRVVFSNPKLPLQVIELVEDPEGEPEVARVALRDGQELTARYEDGARPSSIGGPDGARAELRYEGGSTEVTLIGPDGAEAGAKKVAVPVELRSALRLARAGDLDPRSMLGASWGKLRAVLVGSALAQESEPAQADESITVQRDIELLLDARPPPGKEVAPTSAHVEATCPPFSCLPASPEIQVPGDRPLRIVVSASVPESELEAPADADALDPFRDEAREEREVAQRRLADVTAVVAAIGVTALACDSLDVAISVCVAGLGKRAALAEGAVIALSSHEVEAEGRVIDERAERLYYEAAAREALDRETDLEVCVSPEGFARTCTEVRARPFAAQPPDPSAAVFELRRGIGGTVAGSFVLSQSDGPDCKFSPSPRTSGTLRLTFDSEKHMVTGSFGADERGARPNLRCSLGTANMSWSQSYSATVTQTFTAQELESGGKLSLRLTGTMTGRGSFSFSNCRSGGGASASCPAGKSDSYSYPVELVGVLDQDTQTGSGNIVVRNAPLSTGGTWRVPAGDTP